MVQKLFKNEYKSSPNLLRTEEIAGFSWIFWREFKSIFEVEIKN